ncbi:MAG TPA: methyltransferase MtaB domain-containing protein, partial [bacterium]
MKSFPTLAIPNPDDLMIERAPRPLTSHWGLMKSFPKLAIPNPSDLMFGRALRPFTSRRGLVIGGGKVYPELNFTLPTMEISDATFSDICTRYREAVDEACRRSLDLNVEGLVVEFETLVEMTQYPPYAVELTKIMNDVLESHYSRNGLKSALRITPNDLREFKRPPVLRSGVLLDRMLETFAGCAKAGAEILSIESTGGKEIHDPALLMCDLSHVIFALAVLGTRDMDFLWDRIVRIARENGTEAGGDTACGFGNTAMVLAERHNIPRVFAAVVRSVSAVRSLVAFEKGAVGPGKDCGYENVFLKAITGFPMSMEGKTAACAHMSPIGNIASAMCDLWSNESIQNIKLLGGMAPTVSLEQLAYDCRLMNRSLENQSEQT